MTDVKQGEASNSKTEIKERVIAKRQYPISEDLPITEDEKYLINKFRTKFSPHLDGFTDVRLLQFVRGYCHAEDPEKKSMEVVEKWVNWRVKEHVDTIFHTKYSYREELCKLWPVGIHGWDRQGHPIYIERVGQIHMDVIEKHGFSLEKMIPIHIQNMERIAEVAARLSKRTGKQRYKYVVILDVDGGGLRMLGSSFLTPIKKLIDIDQTYFPETLLKMYLRKVPFSLNALWTFASPFIDAQTKKRIIWGHEGLVKDVDPCMLPHWLGGTCKCKDGRCLEVPFVPGDAKEPDSAFLFEEETKTTTSTTTATTSTTTATTSSSSSTSAVSSSSSVISSSASTAATAAVTTSTAASASSSTTTTTSP